MGVLKKFEQRLEGLVNGTFAKVFKSEVQPVEIAGALQRECDNNATIWNRDRTVVPNDFIVELSTPDFERLSPYSGQLGDELATWSATTPSSSATPSWDPSRSTWRRRTTSTRVSTGYAAVRSPPPPTSSPRSVPPRARPGGTPRRPGWLRLSARGRSSHAVRAAARRPLGRGTLGCPAPGRSGGGCPCAALGGDQRRTPSDLPLDAGARPQHRSRRADRRPRRIAPAL